MSGGEEHLAPIQAFAQKSRELRDGLWADTAVPEQVPPVERKGELLAQLDYLNIRHPPEEQPLKGGGEGFFEQVAL